MQTMIHRLHDSVPGLERAERCAVVVGDYQYCHYLYDGQDDRGWGCGYRTLQTIISWLTHHSRPDITVPGLRRIQEILVEIGDKPRGFVGSRDWIGSVEVGLVIDQLLDVPCKILHSRSGQELDSVFEEVFRHFELRRCPIMMGGDLDASSKGIFGACQTSTAKYLLVLDPHFVASSSSTSENVTNEFLVEKGWAKWVMLGDFSSSSFYNLCLPQIKV